MEFRILGRLEIVDDGEFLEIGAGKPAALLAVLLLHPGETVPATRLIDELWGEAPPVSAAKLVQGYVHTLRQTLGGGVISTHGRGYAVNAATLEGATLDAADFDRIADDAEKCLVSDPARAAGLLRQALRLWRGEPLEGLDLPGRARHEVYRLGERRLAVQETLFDAGLALGRHAALVPELQRLAAAHPFRERLCAQLMIALYRCGRQAEALAAYRDARRLLDEELGLEPGAGLRDLESRILAQATDLDLPSASAPEPVVVPPAPPAIGHRLVTVVAAGLTGEIAVAEQFDAEVAHRVLTRHARLCAEIIERHAGAVQPGGGETVVGVFGLVELHEDDAVRALRAAQELRTALAALACETGGDLAARLGVDAGPVFVGADVRLEPLATGEAVDHAVRLRLHADPGLILIGPGVHRLAGPALRATPRGEVRGRPVWRLDRVCTPSPAVPDTPFVGREEELAHLRCARDTGARLVTVTGLPGIGKSRLLHRFTSGFRGQVVTGRCLPYGEGITYHALAEIVAQLDGGLERVLRGADRAGLISRRVLGAIGPAGEPAGAEETFWAFRRLFEHAARQRPLAVVIEDLHWAEPTLLDLVDHLAALLGDAPVLLLCSARPELLETRPQWAVPQRGRSVIPLDGLGKADTRQLAGVLAAGRLEPAEVNRVVAAAEGNPLFLEQLIAARPDAGGALPPSIQTLLAARIDRLEPAERQVLARGAVEGQRFHRSALAESLPESARAGTGAVLMALVRKQFLYADRPQFAGDDAFRFAHVLIRDVAYRALPGEVRAGLHEGVARWLAGQPGAADEPIGYHLERAARLRTGLGLAGAGVLAARAVARLDAAARTALLRGDVPAAARLLERAVDLLSADDPARRALLPRLGTALFEAGRLADAEKVLDLDGSPLCRVELQRVRLQADPRRWLCEADEVAVQALGVLRRDRDAYGQSRAWSLRATVRWMRGCAADADVCWREAAGHARRAGDDRELFEILSWRASAAAFGPLPVPEAVRCCEEIRSTVARNPVAVAATLHPLGLLYALRGDFTRGSALIEQANGILGELGRLESAVSHHECLLALLAGRPEVAERLLRGGYERLQAMGEGALLATTAAMLARALQARGHDDEAEQECAVSRRYAAPEDLPTQVMWRGVLALVLARRGRLDEAAGLACEAVRLAEPSDLLVIRGDAWLDLADVRYAAGLTGPADEAARQALALYERKSAAVPAAQARSRLTDGGSRCPSPRSTGSVFPRTA
ncbi:BTAD domain-containing putative transcriptional regulator [Actinoplanes sp. GCM10030250]|uniref:BTAD domain-containing putative transcriptional regulator n=1 Tax=Actinoplanes sp. GCM10030250 TaxID=3273376 RepID=UPI003614FDFB